MPDSSPQESAALTSISLEMSPGSLLFKEITVLFLSVWSVTGGLVFEKVSLSLPRCSLALQPSRIANYSYQHSEMLQSICWIHRLKAGRKQFGVVSRQRKKMLLTTHLLNLICTVINILTHSKRNIQIQYEPISLKGNFFI